MNESFKSGYVATDYQTMKDTRSLFQNRKQQLDQNRKYQQSNQFGNHAIDDWTDKDSGGYTPRCSMSRTRNRYRPKSQKPSECDDSLFGKPSQQDYKEWKAPWDQSKNYKPLVYDSTDRAGHYTTETANNQRHVKSASSRRPWR